MTAHVPACRSVEDMIAERKKQLAAGQGGAKADLIRKVRVHLWDYRACDYLYMQTPHMTLGDEETREAHEARRYW